MFIIASIMLVYTILILLLFFMRTLRRSSFELLNVFAYIQSFKIIEEIMKKKFVEVKLSFTCKTFNTENDFAYSTNLNKKKIYFILSKRFFAISSRTGFELGIPKHFWPNSEISVDMHIQ